MREYESSLYHISMRPMSLHILGSSRREYQYYALTFPWSATDLFTSMSIMAASVFISFVFL